MLCLPLLYCVQDEMQAKHEQECQTLEVGKPLYSSIVNFTVNHQYMLYRVFYNAKFTSIVFVCTG